MRRALLLSLLIATPALAQDARTNAAFYAQRAMEFCIRNYGTPEAMIPAFKEAGFSETIEDFAGEKLHWMAAPRNIVNVLVQASPGESYCAISTEKFGVTVATPFVGKVLGHIFTGDIYFQSPEGKVIRPGSPQASQTSCTGYHFFAPQRLIWVQLASVGNDPLCIENGTTQIMVRM
ncbi:MAG: hypothetical protein AAF922_02740 [Pseudomonadota bacterium]